MTYCLGLDIGYSGLKCEMGEIGKAPKKLMLPAGAGPASKLPAQMSGNERDGAIHIMLDGEPWVAGIPVDYLENWERDLHPDYPSTKNYRALFYAALLKTGRDQIDHLVTGLPVSQYLDFNLREKLVERLEGRHQITATKSVLVEKVTVLPQPVGAYMHLVSATNDIDTLEEGRVIVVDPGFFSVDWVAMQGGALRKDSSGTSHKAMSRVLEEACKYFIDEFGAGACTKEKLENAIRGEKSRILVFGERVEIAPFLDRAIKTVAPQAMASMRQAMRDEDQGADIVLLAGGGAQAYAEATREVFPRSKVIVPKDPVLANAQGFYFYGS